MICLLFQEVFQIVTPIRACSRSHPTSRGFRSSSEVAENFHRKAHTMKCYRCSNPATLHVTEIIKNVPHELHLCEECAQQYLANPKSAFAESQSAEEIEDEEIQSELEEIDKLVCPNCGISFKEFRSQGRLGCPHDYIAFQEELIPLLENIHGETQHIGRIPKRAPEDSRKQFQIIKLKNDLRQAIAEESYEKAAELRDEIQRLERELKPT